MSESEDEALTRFLFLEVEDVAPASSKSEFSLSEVAASLFLLKGLVIEAFCLDMGFLTRLDILVALELAFSHSSEDASSGSDSSDVKKVLFDAEGVPSPEVLEEIPVVLTR